MRLIASNAGVEGDVIIEKLLGKPFEIGYNAVQTPSHICSLCCGNVSLGSWSIRAQLPTMKSLRLQHIPERHRVAEGHAE